MDYRAEAVFVDGDGDGHYGLHHDYWGEDGAGAQGFLHGEAGGGAEGAGGCVREDVLLWVESEGDGGGVHGEGVLRASCEGC